MIERYYSWDEHTICVDDDETRELRPDYTRYVLASDYDALAARLAEAERLLRRAREIPPHPGGFFDAEVLRQRIDAFLRPADSASEQESASHG